MYATTDSQNPYPQNYSYYSVQQPVPLSIPPPSSIPQQTIPDPYPNYGSYPVNYATVAPQPVYNPDPNASSSNWVVKQCCPISYSPAVQPLRNETIASASNDVSFHRVAKNLHSKKLKKPKVGSQKKIAIQSVYCNLCKIECNSVKLYEKHLSGKLHSKSLKKMYVLSTMPSGEPASQLNSIAGGTGMSGTQGIPGVPSVIADLEKKKQKQLEGSTAVGSLRICSICNVSCTGDIAFADHIAGKKHLTQERALNGTNPNSATKPQEKKSEKGTNGPATCDVCKISCTSKEGLAVHRQGKKHKKNLEKLRSSIPNLSVPPSTSVLTVPTTIATVNNGESSKSIGPEPDPLNCKKVRLAEQNDLETKRRKVHENGAAADAVKTCTICNVVCNSQTVFDSHLAGQKHAAMVKQAEAKVAADNQIVTAAT